MATCVVRSVRARMVQLVITLLGSVPVNLDTLEQFVTPVRSSILITMLLLMMSYISDLLFCVALHGGTYSTVMHRYLAL